MNDRKNALSDYLRSLYKIPVLSKEDERKLWEKIKNGDEMAKDRLITHNLRFVVEVIKSKPYWKNGSVSMEDLLQFGNLGLMKAADVWVPKEGAKFASFARRFIERYVNRGIENTQNIIRVPVNVQEEIRAMKYHDRRLAQELGRDPTSEEIANHLGKSVKRIHHLKSLLLREPISLDTLMYRKLAEDDSNYE